MSRIVQELLRLECAKQRALIEGDAPAYDESVRAQLHLLDSTTDLETAARHCPDTLATLAKTVRLNVVLFWNRISVSPAFQFISAGYTAGGEIETRIGRRIQVKA